MKAKLTITLTAAEVMMIICERLRNGGIHVPEDSIGRFESINAEAKGTNDAVFVTLYVDL